MNRFDTVLFDLDGTLLYTLPDIHAAVNAALTAHGYPLNTLEDTRAAVGWGSRWLIEKSLPPDAGREAADAVLVTYRAYYAAHLTVHTVPYEGIEAMLASLKARGVLVRWFDADRIRDYVRITVGSREQMDVLLREIRAILKDRSEEK